MAKQRFIPGIYNYCDRWCERCPLSHRCLSYAMEKAEDAGDPAARDLKSREFWARVLRRLDEALEMVQEEAEAHGIDLDDPRLVAKARRLERARRRRTARHLSLPRAAKAYGNAADRWLEGAMPLLEAKESELETQASIGVGDPHAQAAELVELLEVIQWYQYFIHIKLRRAIESRAREETEMDYELKEFPRDSDGSAKIALIAMDRSIGAWAALRAALGEEADGILDLLAKLAVLRRKTEELFPAARAFVRPGFDEPRRRRRKA
jgi:hypothetical protein